MKKYVVIFMLLLMNCLYSMSQVDSTSASYFYGRASAGLIIGNLPSGSAQFASGYHFRFGLETGVGLGLEMYDDRYSPVFVELRYHFGKKRTQPFIGFMGGALFNMNQYYYGNRTTGTFGAQIGLTHFFNKHLGFSTSVGYRYLPLYSGIYYNHFDFAPMYTPASLHNAEVRIGLVLK